MKKPFLGENATNLRASDDSSLEFFVNDSPINDTGRYLVTLEGKSNSFASLRKICKDKLGLKIASTSDFEDKIFTEDDIADADVLIFKDLGIALLGPDDDGKVDRYKSLDDSTTVQSEQIVYTSAIPNSATSTWGIQSTKTLLSNFTGKNVNVAVLDTGLDLLHPDFVGRNINSASFVPSQSVQDGNGHGTHCIGTACGNTDSAGVRYGIAKNANIFAGKVLNNAGSGAQSWILGGMQWAGQNRCKVVSMSLGSFGGATFDPAYERAAQFVLSKGGIVVAAAGNSSNRIGGLIAPVGSPANCPSILAVAAIDANPNLEGGINFSVANFSCGTIFFNQGCKVDIAGPGVGIYSSWPLPTRYRTISGTSMATPHVAGLLALLWEQFPTFSPEQIIVKLFRDAQALALPNTDVGIGLAVVN